MRTLTRSRLELAELHPACQNYNEENFEYLSYRDDELEVVLARTQASLLRKVRRFCAWSSVTRPISGDSLVYPWIAGRRLVEGFPCWASDEVVVVSKHVPTPRELMAELLRHRRWSVFEIRLGEGEGARRYRLVAKGLTNKVHLEDAQGSTVAVFPPLLRSFKISNGISNDDLIALQAAVGTEAIARVRRFSLLARAI